MQKNPLEPTRSITGPAMTEVRTREIAQAAKEIANLLGDLWEGGDPDFAAALSVPDVRLHLYGKTSARPGRKMGHLSALGASVDEAREKVLRARDLFARRTSR